MDLPSAVVSQAGGSVQGVFSLAQSPVQLLARPHAGPLGVVMGTRVPGTLSAQMTLQRLVGCPARPCRPVWCGWSWTGAGTLLAGLRLRPGQGLKKAAPGLGQTWAP